MPQYVDHIPSCGPCPFSDLCLLRSGLPNTKEVSDAGIPSHSPAFAKSTAIQLSHPAAEVISHCAGDQLLRET
jgi:hypothetical protein